MAQRGRPGLSPEQKRELWSRWKAGESLSEIGRALGKQPGSIHGVVASNGGYVPAVRRRSARVLTISEREEISRGLAEGASLRRIAGRLQRAPSSISREVARHGGRHRYRAARAQERAWDRARRPKPCKLAAVPPLRELVAGKLAEEWSPEQISGWLARTYPGEQDLQVSTETIYRSLFVQARGVLRKSAVFTALTRPVADFERDQATAALPGITETAVLRRIADQAAAHAEAAAGKALASQQEEARAEAIARAAEASAWLCRRCRGGWSMTPPPRPWPGCWPPTAASPC